MEYPKLPSFRLDGKKALVTGAGRGIGMGASIALAESGAKVTLVSRTEKELKEISDYINSQGYNASYTAIDVNNENEIQQLIKNSDPFDILINNAGTNKPAKLIEIANLLGLTKERVRQIEQFAIVKLRRMFFAEQGEEMTVCSA